MESVIDKNIGFEILSNNEDSVTLKRVFSYKGKNKKKMALPTLTMYYMSEEELKKLQEIEEKLQKQADQNKKNIFRKISYYLNKKRF